MLTLDIIEIAGFITAIGVIIGAIIKIHKILSRMEDKFDEYDSILKENTMHILKMALLSDDLPITDRINAGKRYLELGGNGYGKIIYNQLIKQIEEEQLNK